MIKTCTKARVDKNNITPDPRDWCPQYPLPSSSLCILQHCLHRLVHRFYFDLNSGIDLGVLIYTPLHPKMRHSNYKMQQLILWQWNYKNHNLHMHNANYCIMLQCNPKIQNQIKAFNEIEYPFRGAQLIEAVIISFRVRYLHNSWSF